MIVTRKQAEKLLGRELRGPEYIGKRWFLLSRSLPHRNLGGFPTKAGAEKHERDVQYFKHNPKSFGARNHDWGEILIERKGKKLTRKKIRDYYKRVQKKIWPFLEGQTVMVIFAPSKNTFVRRRNDPSGKHIRLTKLEGIDDPKSYEYWINRRVVEFHPVLTSKMTDLLWLDLDMHETKSPKLRKRLLGAMKRSVPKLKKVFNRLGVKKVYVYDSGTDGGIHLEGMLPKKRNVDTVRKELRKLLDDVFEGDEMFTTGMAKSGEIRLDTTTFHRLGSLRAPYSMTVSGKTKKRLGR